jgi:Protein of unknown function (DUF664)
VPVGVYLHGVPIWTTPERPEPPHNPVDERTALEDRLDFQRTTLLLKCGGSPQSNWPNSQYGPRTSPLLGLIRHMSAVESWFHSYDGQPDHPFFWNYVLGETDGFGDVDVNHAAHDLASYQASVERSHRAIAGRGLDEAIPDEDYTLRWVYLHMIEEYARHNGHAYLVRERIDGATGE